MTFSDTKPDTQQTKEIILKPVNTIKMIVPQAIAPTIKKTDKPAIPKINYQLVITEPANSTTLRGVDNIKVNVQITPPLDKRHKIQVLLDGKLQGAPQRKTDYLLRDVYRGEHQITVQITNESGKTLKEANSTIYVFRPFIRNKSSDGPKSTLPEK